LHSEISDFADRSELKESYGSFYVGKNEFMKTATNVFPHAHSLSVSANAFFPQKNCIVASCFCCFCSP